MDWKYIGGNPLNDTTCLAKRTSWGRDMRKTHRKINMKLMPVLKGMDKVFDIVDNQEFKLNLYNKVTISEEIY